MELDSDQERDAVVVSFREIVLGRGYGVSRWGNDPASRMRSDINPSASNLGRISVFSKVFCPDFQVPTDHTAPGRVSTLRWPRDRVVIGSAHAWDLRLNRSQPIIDKR